MAKISWAGQSCFQISVSGSKGAQGAPAAEIVIDPFDESFTGLKLPNLSADILLVTHDHKDHNNVKAIKGEPFLISGPGEYEVKEVYIQGIPAFHDDKDGKEKGNNTIYVIEAEGIKFCHLGDLGQKQLSDEQLEKIDSIDVLMIPVGGEYTIDSSAAQRIISQIGPKIVIPMHYALPKLKIKIDDVSKFLKTMGKDPRDSQVSPQNKLILKASVLPKEGAMEIAVLSP